ncbi:MAG: serine/threonine protein kinase [Lachnospiraceae bacterium]|nr:serine/threonine protein kinase [Lachnospiraceae bacterium]
MNQWSDDAPFSLPGDLAEIYEVKSCLKYSAQASTYLLRKKETGVLYLLKTALSPEYAAQLVNERKILNFIHASEDSWYPKLFPTAVFLEKRAPDDELYYIRTYIEGKTLEELCETNYEKPGIPLMQTLDYMISLADMLRFLHSLNPPLIHRDIKPQNIIVDSDGQCHYIDLGISRFYQPDKRSDTLVMGTQLTAPPEQFGYKQSDVRSDLYSLGLTFFYCLTGEYTPTDELLAELDEPVAAIIRRATMFDPDRRYQSADEFLAALLAVRFPQLYPERMPDTETANAHKRNPIGIGAAVSALVLILAAGAWFNRVPISHLLSDAASGNESASGGANSLENIFSSADADSLENISSSADAGASEAVYTFTEPLIEEAVRSQLSIGDDEPVTEEDLEKIVSLHIFGQQIYSDDDEFWFQGDYPFVYDNEMQESGLYERTGTISSLEDITHMPNLHTLCLYRQQITDLSVLADTELSIRELGIGYNPVSDLSPLEGNTDIETLNLAGLEISDCSVLSTLKNLKNLNISSTGIQSLAGLENCAIEELNIFDLELADYSQLSALEHLTYLEIDHLTNSVISAMSETSLTSLFIHSMNGFSVGQLSDVSSLESLGVYVGNMDETSLESIDLPALRELDIKDATIADFYGLSSLESLTSLKIYASTCLSYDGLTDIPNLHTITCTQEQAEAIRAQYPDADYYYAY